MSIGKMINRTPVTVRLSDTLAKVASLMEDENIGAIIVVKGRQPVGIVTDRDLALAMGARGLSPATAVAAVMANPVTTIRDDEGILDVTNMMMEQSVRRLAIVDEHNELVGLVSVDDLIPLLSVELGNIAEGMQTAAFE